MDHYLVIEHAGYQSKTLLRHTADNFEGNVVQENVNFEGYGNSHLQKKRRVRHCITYAMAAANKHITQA